MTLFDLPTLREKLDALEKKLAAPGFWDNPESAQATAGALKGTKAVLDPAEALVRRIEDVEVLFDLAQEADHAKRRQQNQAHAHGRIGVCHG